MKNKYFTIYEGRDNETNAYAIRSVEAKDKTKAMDKICKSDYMSFRGIYTGHELVKVIKELVSLAKLHSKEDVFYGMKSILSPKEDDVVWDVLTREKLEETDYATPDGYNDYFHLSEVKAFVKTIKAVKPIVVPVDKDEVTQWLIKNAKKQIGSEVLRPEFWLHRDDEYIYNVFQWDGNDDSVFSVKVFEENYGKDSIDDHYITAYQIGLNEIKSIRAGGVL